MKKITLFLILIYSTISLRADISPNAILGKKTDRCKMVFDKLKSTKGLLPAQAPYFSLVRELPNPNFAIAMAKGSNIYLDEVTYDECMKMGKDSLNALAFILSHELAHYTHKHNERHRFLEQEDQKKKKEIFSLTSSQPNLNESELEALESKYKEISTKYKIRENEAEADLEAGFMSFLAGYRSLTAAPDFLDRVYERFKLDKTGGNYASLEERKEIIRRTTMQLDSLTDIFNAANCAAAIGNLDFAVEGYSYISNYFESPELLNNMGVLGIKKLLDGKSLGEVPYVFPITLDIEFGQASHSFGELTDEWEKMEKENLDFLLNLVNTCIDFFELATQINESYYIADLNRSIAYYAKYLIERERSWLLKTDPKDNLILARSAATLAKIKLTKFQTDNKKGRIDVATVLAILSHKLGYLEEANSLIGEAEKQDSLNFMVLMNKAVFKDTRAQNDFLIVQQIYDRIGDNAESDSNVEKENDPIKEAAKDHYNEELEKETLYGDSINDVLRKHENNWNLQKKIKIRKPDSMLPISTWINYANTDQYNLYQWQKKKGSSRILNSLSFYTAKNFNDEAVLSSRKIGRGSTIKELFEAYGNYSDRFESGSATMLFYKCKSAWIEDRFIKNGIFFFIKDNKVDSWIIYQENA